VGCLPLVLDEALVGSGTERGDVNMVMNQEVRISEDFLLEQDFGACGDDGLVEHEVRVIGVIYGANSKRRFLSGRIQGRQISKQAAVILYIRPKREKTSGG